MEVSRLRRRLGTIRVRLTVLATLIVGVGLVIGAAVIVWLVHRSILNVVESDTEQRAHDTAVLLESGGEARVPPAAGKGRAAVQVVDRAGSVIASSPELRGDGPLLSTWPSEGMVRQTVSDAPFGDGSDYTVVGLPASLAGRSVAIYSARSLEPVSTGVEATSYALAVAVPLLLAVSTLAAWLLVGRSLRPVEAMRSQVAAISASELDRRVRVPEVQDELSRLAETMNAMLSRVQTAHDRQRQFVGDAAHELRSPLAAIRAQLEVGLAHPDDTEWKQLARQVHRETERLNRLTEELLLLSRSDDGDLQQPDELVDLDELVLHEVDAVRSRGQVRVDLAPFSAARLRGRPDDLRAMVRNLIENAERHARSTMRVSLSTDDNEAELVVADDGAGIAPEFRERVFERFFRLQSARDRGSGGAGLGLAIVRDVATRHRGSVRVADNADGDGVALHVRLAIEGANPVIGM